MSFSLGQQIGIDHYPDLSSLQPDLLNFKKGWMAKLYEDGMVIDWNKQ